MATVLSVGNTIHPNVDFARSETLSTLGEISLNEVLCHDRKHDCWVIIYDRVYNVTKFMTQHPGGEDLLLEYAGRDASIAFRSSGHSGTAVNLLNDFLIGELPTHERIFRKVDGFKLGDIPE